MVNSSGNICANFRKGLTSFDVLACGAVGEKKRNIEPLAILATLTLKSWKQSMTCDQKVTGSGSENNLLKICIKVRLCMVDSCGPTLS